MTISLYIDGTDAVCGVVQNSGWGQCLGFHFNDGATMKELNFHEKKKIRNRLLAIYRETGKVTERDLLRLSALTGVNYSMIAEIHKATHYRPLHGVKDYVKDKMASNK